MWFELISLYIFITPPIMFEFNTSLRKSHSLHTCFYRNQRTHISTWYITNHVFIQIHTLTFIWIATLLPFLDECFHITQCHTEETLCNTVNAQKKNVILWFWSLSRISSAVTWYNQQERTTFRAFGIVILRSFTVDAVCVPYFRYVD